MFTGLIQTTGTLQPLGEHQIQISCNGARGQTLLQNAAIGDSISVDGVCLTVTQLLSGGFTAAASPETLDRTTLGKPEGNAWVNLESSLQVGSKLGGHFVTGHIDGVGYLEVAESTADSWEMSFHVADPRVSRYIVSKGSIAVNGVSLTVADCNPTGTWFKVAVIPLTYADTNLCYLKPNSRVNLEGDVLGKYVEKFMRLSNGKSAAIADFEAIVPLAEVTPAFLAEQGYL